MEMVAVSVFSDIQVGPKSLTLSNKNLSICIFDTFIDIIKKGMLFKYLTLMLSEK